MVGHVARLQSGDEDRLASQDPRLRTTSTVLGFTPPVPPFMADDINYLNAQ